MLTPEQISGLQVAAARITDPVNDYLLRDIACRIRDQVLPAMAALRATVDEAETQTAAGCWPYPSYGELLFSVR